MEIAVEPNLATDPIGDTYVCLIVIGAVKYKILGVVVILCSPGKK